MSSGASSLLDITGSDGRITHNETPQYVHARVGRATTTTSAYNKESQSAHLRARGQGGITTPLLPSIF